MAEKLCKAYADNAPHESSGACHTSALNVHASFRQRTRRICCHGAYQNVHTGRSASTVQPVFRHFRRLYSGVCFRFPYLSFYVGGYGGLILKQLSTN